eukprot:6184859-Pleurochrysis_carterae.AAC.2
MRIEARMNWETASAMICIRTATGQKMPPLSKLRRACAKQCGSEEARARGFLIAATHAQKPCCAHRASRELGVQIGRTGLENLADGPSTCAHKIHTAALRPAGAMGARVCA